MLNLSKIELTALLSYSVIDRSNVLRTVKSKEGYKAELIS